MRSDGRQPHVLVVNDTQELLDLFRELLEDEGYRVTISVACLDTDEVQILAPDLIIQDLLFEQSPEKGWTFLTLMRLTPTLAHVPLILCTAATDVVKDAGMAAELRQLGVRVVLKPFAIEELLAVLREALEETRTAATVQFTQPLQG